MKLFTSERDKAEAFYSGFDAGLNEISGRCEPDAILLERALCILHRMATERTGWRSFFGRWYYSDEPLRNDAANLVRDARFGMCHPLDTRLVGDTEHRKTP